MQRTLNLITAPATYTVLKAEAKKWLKWDPSLVSDDSIVDDLIATATQNLEYYTGRSFINQTFEMQFIPQVETDVIAGQLNQQYESLPETFKLWRPPLVSVTSIKAVEENGTEHVQSATKYTIDTSSKAGRIKLHSDVSWDYYTNGHYLVRYVAGYGTDAAHMPAMVLSTIRTAMQMYTSQIYGAREKADYTISPEVKAILAPITIREWDLD